MMAVEGCLEVIMIRPVARMSPTQGSERLEFSRGSQTVSSLTPLVVKKCVAVFIGPLTLPAYGLLEQAFTLHLDAFH